MTTAGKLSIVEIGTDGTNWETVANLNTADMNQDGDNIDVTTFTQEYINRIQGLKDVTWSLGGFLDLDDTDGQVVILQSLKDDTELHVRFLPDGTNGFEQEVKVSAFNTSTSVDGAVELSVDLEGTGEITLPV